MARALRLLCATLHYVQNVFIYFFFLLVLSFNYIELSVILSSVFLLPRCE